MNNGLPHCRGGSSIFPRPLIVHSQDPAARCADRDTPSRPRHAQQPPCSHVPLGLIAGSVAALADEQPASNQSDSLLPSCVRSTPSSVQIAPRTLNQRHPNSTQSPQPAWVLAVRSNPPLLITAQSNPSRPQVGSLSFC